MTDIATVLIKAKADGVALVDGQLQSLNNTASETSKSFLGMDKSMSQTAINFAKMAGIASVGVALGAATSSAIAFEKSMKEISTLTNSMDMDGLTQSVRELSIEFGQDRQDQAKGLYAIISAGAATAEAATGTLTAANKLAIGGVTDVATAADGLTSALNAYGLDASKAGDISDAMFVAMKAGKTTIGELSSSLGNVAPMASALGVSFDELMAATSAVTKGGLNTSMTMTGLKAVLSGISKPSGEASDAAKKLGLDLSAGAIESAGFAGVMGDIIEKTGGSKEALLQLFGSVEAVNVVMALTSKGGAQAFTDILQAMDEKSGATEEAFDKMKVSADFLAGVIKQKLMDALLQLGVHIMSVLQPVMVAIVGNFESLGTAAKILGALLVTGAVYAGIVALPGILSTVGLALIGVTAKVVALTVALLLNPFAWVAIAIGGLVAAFVLFGDELITINGTTASVTDYMVASWKWVVDTLGPYFDAVAIAWGDLMAAFGGGLDDSDKKNTGTWKAIGDTVYRAINYIGRGLEFMAALFGTILAALVVAVSSWGKNTVAIVKGAWDGITNVFKGKLDFSALEAALRTSMLDPMSNVKQGAIDAWKQVEGKDYIQGTIDTLSTASREVSNLAAKERDLNTELEEVTVSAQRRGDAVKEVGVQTGRTAEEAEKLLAVTEKNTGAEGKAESSAKKLASAQESLSDKISKTETALKLAEIQTGKTTDAKLLLEIANIKAGIASGTMTAEQVKAADKLLAAALAANKLEVATGKAADKTAKLAQETAAATAEADPFAKAFVSAVERIDGAFVDLWKNIGSGWNSFKDALINSFKQMLAEMAHLALTRPIVVAITTAVTGGTTPGAAAGTAGTTGTGLVSSVSSLWNAAKGGYSGAMTSLATSYSQVGGYFSGIANAGGPMSGIAGSAANGAANQAAIYGGGGWQAAGNLGLNMIAGYAGTKLGQTVFDNEGSTGIGAMAGGLVGSIWGPFGTAIGSFIGEGLEKVLGDLLGFGGKPGNNWGNVQVNTATGDVSNPFGEGNWSAANGEVAKTLGETILGLADIIGGSKESFKIAVNDQGEMRVNGKEFTDASALIKDTFLIMVNSSTELSGSTKNLIKNFDGTTEEVAAFAGILYEVLGPNGKVPESVYNLVSVFEGTADDTKNFTLAMISLGAAIKDNPVRQALEDWDAAAESASWTMTDIMDKQTQVVGDLMMTFDGSADSAVRLASEFGNMQIMAYELTIALKSVSASVTELTGNAAQDIRNSVMTEKELYDWREGERSRLFDLLGTLTDPAEIADTVTQITALTNAIWNALPDAQRTDERVENFAAYLDRVDAVAQRQINVALGDIDDEMVNMNDAMTQMLTASTSMEGVADDFSVHVSTFGKSAKDLYEIVGDLVANGIKVTVNGGYLGNPNTSGEVSP